MNKTLKIYDLKKRRGIVVYILKYVYIPLNVSMHLERNLHLVKLPLYTLGESLALVYDRHEATVQTPVPAGLWLLLIVPDLCSYHGQNCFLCSTALHC